MFGEDRTEDMGSLSDRKIVRVLLGSEAATAIKKNGGEGALAVWFPEIGLEAEVAAREFNGVGWNGLGGLAKRSCAGNE